MEDFLDAIEQDKDLWEALELRVLAIKADGAWHNLATRIWLRSTAPDAPRSEWITTDFVLAERHVMRRDELRTVLTNVAGGQLTLGTTSILYQDTSTGSTLLPLDRWYDWTYRDTDPGNEWLQPYGGRVLHALATTASTLWGRLPNGRQALDRLADTLTPRPFRGFHELARHATGSPPFVPDRDQVGIMVFAPYEVRFVPDAWRWADGRLSGRLVSTNPKAHPATKVLAFPPAGVTQDLSVTPGASWTEERPGEWHQTFEIDPAGVRSMTVALMCGGVSASFKDLTAPPEGPRSPTHKAYQLIDPELHNLEKWLALPDGTATPPKADKDHFEHAIGRLLVLAGWQVDVRWGTHIREGVDVVAFHPAAAHVLAIECTIGPMKDKEKLRHLLDRRTRLAQALPDHAVDAVVVTRQAADEANAEDVRTAAAAGIIVLFEEQLREWIALARGGYGPAAALAFFERSRPAVVPSSYSLFGG